jgi:hypothetical protein
MSMVRLPYGKDLVDVMLPDGAAVAYPRHLPAVTDVRREIRRAMDDPTGCEPLRYLAQGKFGDWLRQAHSPREVIERFSREGFTPEQSSKAFMCARALERYTVIVSCTGIQKDDLERMFFRYAPSPQAAVDEALAAKGKGASVLVIPYAVSCVPAVGEGKGAVRPG